MAKITVMKGDARLTTNHELILAVALPPMMSSLSVISLPDEIKFHYGCVVTAGLRDRNAVVRPYGAESTSTEFQMAN
jgi:hypothetical protein